MNFAHQFSIVSSFIKNYKNIKKFAETDPFGHPPAQVHAVGLVLPPGDPLLEGLHPGLGLPRLGAVEEGVQTHPSQG